MKRVGKKKIEKNVILIVLLVLALLLSFTVYSIKTDRKLTFVEKAIKDSVLVIGSYAYKPIEYIKEKIDIYNFNEKKYNEYKDITSTLETNKRNEAYINELEKENSELKSILNLNNTLSEYSGLYATVIARNVNYWFNDITIDKGSTSGIEVDMAVIIDGGLIGKISSVSNFTSTVTLLTTEDLRNKISVKINDNIYGLLSGYDAESNTYIVEGISDNSEIEINDIVTTTGLSETFPSGILIGYVESITTDSFDLARIVKVRPSVSYNDISYVKVLDRKAIQ